MAPCPAGAGGQGADSRWCPAMGGPQALQRDCQESSLVPSSLALFAWTHPLPPLCPVCHLWSGAATVPQYVIGLWSGLTGEDSLSPAAREHCHVIIMSVPYPLHFPF